VNERAPDALVERLLELLVSCRAGPVEVVGDDLVARSLRERVPASVGVGDPGVSADPKPAVVIDATGSPDSIREALHRLRDLGTLVLTRPMDRGAAVNMNLYTDLHFRSLTVVGMGDLTASS
jgi:threonine dehydrogenase-like Zn-dependent dehydrogenase